MEIGYIISTPTSGLVCNLNKKCPSNYPYIYEGVAAVLGTILYYKSGSPFAELPHDLGYAEIYEDDYLGIGHYEPPSTESTIFYNGRDCATMCSKSCTKTQGIIYELDAEPEDDKTTESEDSRTYDTGFCYNRTKVCLDPKYYRRIRADGYHPSITCVKDCTKYDGYVLKKDELFSDKGFFH